MSRPPLMRRRYLINRPLQIKYACMIGAVLFVMLILVEFHTYWTIHSIYPHIFSTLLGLQLKALQGWLFINGLFYTVGVAILSIFISHRIAGPLYRLEKAVDEALASDDPARPIVLRQDDEFHTLADKINRLIARLSQAKHRL
jgi:hypothetical protein